MCEEVGDFSSDGNYKKEIRGQKTVHKKQLKTVMKININQTSLKRSDEAQAG